MSANTDALSFRQGSENLTKKLKPSLSADPSSLDGLDGVFNEPPVAATPDSSSTPEVQRLRNELMNGLFRDSFSEAKRKDDSDFAAARKRRDDFNDYSAEPRRHRDGRVDFEPYQTGYERPGNPFNRSSYRMHEAPTHSHVDSVDGSAAMEPADTFSTEVADSLRAESIADYVNADATESYEGEVDYSESYQGQPTAQSYDFSSQDDAEATTFDAAEVAAAQQSVADVANSLVSGADRVSKHDLIHILEGFVRILKTDEVATAKSVPLIVGTTSGGSPSVVAASSARAQIVTADDQQYAEASVVDKTAELEEMRKLVVEAQETIIKLLTDRVEDRARIATLETELRLLPDLQEQADRAMAVAFKTEDFRAELHKVKYELQAYRAVSSRRSVPRGPRAWLSTVRRWFLKAQGRSMAQIHELRQQAADNREQP